ncbi:MAG: type IV secretion protein Rhs, partial [Methylomonas sp.]
MLRCSRIAPFLAIACLYLVFFQNAACAANQAPSALPANVARTIIKMHQKPGSDLPAQLQQHLQETSDLLLEALAEDQLQIAGKANQLPFKQQILEAKRFEIADFRLQVEAELAQTRAKLAKLNVGGQLDAFDNYAAQVSQRFDSLNKVLSKFTSAQKNGARRLALNSAIFNVNALQSPPGVTAPNAIPSPTTRQGYAVQATPVTPSKSLPGYLGALPNNSNFASLLNLVGSAQAAAPGTPSQASACSYTAADLAATEDVVINPAIQALAAQLNYSPVKIFQYVYNNIKYEPYFGSLKGSLGVMYSNAGGATDQASFLIALLRASN